MRTNTKNKILSYIHTRRQARPHDLIREFRLSHVAIHKQLKQLVEKRLLKRVGKPPTVHYVPVEKPQSQQKKLAEIAKKYNLTFVVLFGSQARHEKPNTESDMDIAVLAKKAPDYKQYNNIYGKLLNLFKNQYADIRFLNGTDLLFQHNVVRDGILLYGDGGKYRDYKLSIQKRYSDDGQKYFPFLDRLLIKQQELLEQYI